MTKEQFWKLRDEQGKAPPSETINGHWSHLEPKCSCGISLRVNWGLVYCPHQPCGKAYTEPHEMPPPPVFVFSCIKCGKFDCQTHSKWESNDQTPKGCGMKPQTPPSGWPKEFAFTDNPWFNAWRPRPSDAGRMTACLAWTCLPRDNTFTFAKDGVNQTAEEKLVERKGKTDKGTSDHNLMKVGKLKGQEERFGKFQPEHHEVRLFYDLLTLSPVTDRAKFPAAENDAFRKMPDSRRYVFGTTDYLNPETKRTADLKTGKVKEDAIRQTALYAHMAGIDTGNYTLEVWNKRARTDRIYTPGDFAQSNESLKLATTKMLERVRTLLLSGDEPEATPGEGGCSFCPSRFFCDSYVDIYLPSVPIKTLRNWLHAELNAYHNQEI